MMLSAHLLLAATALCCFATTLATPMDGFATGHKCRCLTTTSKLIPMRFFRRIEILPPGPNCSHTEILITTKDNKVVCVHPLLCRGSIMSTLKSHREAKEARGLQA